MGRSFWIVVMPLIVRPGRPATHHAIAGSVFATARPTPGGAGDPADAPSPVDPLASGALGIAGSWPNWPSIDLDGVRMVRANRPYDGMRHPIVSYL
ncbi:hypothetical protein A6A27_00415 [Micromonospora sp. CB01531]|nr:hypothetical protein A6A27_00415 [Micromonospora sp. CB01531]